VSRSTAIARFLARDAFLVLATLAIALRIMLPAGYMPGQATGDRLPFALVLCTGNGPMTIQPGEDLGARHGEAPGEPSAHDTPCPFAAQGAAVAPPTITAVGQAKAVAYAERPLAAAANLTPGRGLAAPPPPPTGPPSVLI
jgi:hypothetical protein